MILPSLLVYIFPRMARMSPPLRASNEGLLRPRVARAQGTHWAIPLPAGGLFQHPARSRSREFHPVGIATPSPHYRLARDSRFEETGNHPNQLWARLESHCV